MTIENIHNIYNISLFSLVLIIALITAAIVCYLKLYHGNLRILLINISVIHCFLISLLLAEEIMALINFNGQYRMINDLLVDLCTFAAVFNMACLFYERLIAWKLDKRYETMCVNIPWFGITLVFFDWSFASICAFLIYTNVVTVSNLAIMAIVIAVIVLLLFLFSPSLTYKRYASQQTQQISLSQRYQMSENYRSAKLLTRIVWSFGICIIATAILYVLKSNQSSTAPILLFSYSFAYISQIICYPILLLRYETKVKNLIFPSKRIPIAKSITGKDLIISNVNEQREAYFKSYKQAWA